MLLILVFAYMYFMVYKDLYNTEKLVRAGILGKVASATPDLYYLLFKPASPKSFGSPFAPIIFLRLLSFCSYDGSASRKT